MRWYSVNEGGGAAVEGRGRWRIEEGLGGFELVSGGS